MWKKIIVRLFVLASIVTLLSVLAWIILVINPFEWGAVYSPSFTWSKFEQVKIGEPIGAVIRRLGYPISPPGLYLTNMPGGRLAACGEPSECEAYKFAGTLLVGGREAIVITNVRTGRVLAKWVNREP